MAAYIRSIMNNSVSNTVIIEFSKRNGSYRNWLDTNKGKFSQFRYHSLRFENSIITVFDPLVFITYLIYAATPPPY